MSSRHLLDELLDGVRAMGDHRAGKITLRTHNVEELPILSVSGGTIRAIREELGVSRAVFARRLRISTRTLESWEQGRSKPNAQAAALILMVRAHPDTLNRLGALSP